MKNLNDIEALIKEAQIKMEEARDYLHELKKEKILFLIKNEMLITDLSNYSGMGLDSISAYDEEGNYILLPCDESVRVGIDGRLRMSSFNGGRLIFNSDTGKYEVSAYGMVRELNIHGFYDVRISNLTDYMED